MAFTLPDLPYAYDALEPYIDMKTMQIHHGKHHAGYTNNLNNAIKDTAHANKSIEELIASPANAAIRNNGGGYYNHSLFWQLMSSDGGGEPTGALADAIDDAFGSFEDFKSAFAGVAATRFGSGWAWLIQQEDGSLALTSTPNQDNPLMDVAVMQGKPLLGLDVWEHAYYLNYQNRRADYIDAFFNVVNWDKVAELYEG
jgi:Fe-Mn family superoxide dismutase